MKQNFKLSGYTTTRNCIEQKYPFLESIVSMIPFCDEVVVLDGGSDDGTYESLLSLKKDYPDKIVVEKFERDWGDKRHAIFDGQQKAIARSICKGDWLWQQDSDEIVHENDTTKIKPFIETISKQNSQIELIALPVVEYWGNSQQKVRMDINPWKPRLSKNNPVITHGIPLNHRSFDKEGEVFSLGSDGCCYIHSQTFQSYPFASFMNEEYKHKQMMGLSGNKAAVKDYEIIFNSIINQIPGVHHYSWFNIERKVHTYKNYWSKHWSSLYNTTIEDLPEHNKFFNKPWKNVTDQEIKNISRKLELEMGGWIFHNLVDFSKKTPSIKIDRDHPKIMKNWIEKNRGNYV